VTAEYRFTFHLLDGSIRVETSIGDSELRKALAFVLMGAITVPHPSRPPYDFTRIDVEVRQLPPLPPLQRNALQQSVQATFDRLSDEKGIERTRVVFPESQE
jgi:hypothetical protein